jgi:hypothetical protein
LTDILIEQVLDEGEYCISVLSRAATGRVVSTIATVEVGFVALRWRCV